MAKKCKKILAFRADSGSCWLARLSNPLRYLATLHPEEYEVGITGILDTRSLHIPDVFLCQRQYKSDVYTPIMQAQKKLGKTVIYEADDNFFEVPPWNPAFKSTYKHKVVQDNIKMFLENSDAVFVSTDELKKAYSQYNDRIYVLPNSLDFNHIHEPSGNHAKPVILYQGSNTHKRDIAILFKAFERLNKDDDVYMKLWHVSEGPKGKNIYRPPFCGLEGFFQMLAQMGAQTGVGLCPLVPNKFNAAKSNIKHLEYGANGIPTIASDFGPYAETIEHEKTGILVSNPADWYYWIRNLIENPGIRQQLVKNAQAEIREKYDISKNYILWKNAIDEILES